MKELLYIAAIDDKNAAIKSTFSANKITIVSINDLYKMQDDVLIGGDIKSKWLACLYSRAKNEWYYRYYRWNDSVLYYWKDDYSYQEISASYKIPMCSVYLKDDTVIIANSETACITQLHVFDNNFTGVTFDSVIWDHKLFLHLQTFKVYGNGFYLIYNCVGILKSDLSIRIIYETKMSEVKYLERKYGLRPLYGEPNLSENDSNVVKQRLQLFKLNKRGDGVYLDNARIYGG